MNFKKLITLIVLFAYVFMASGCSGDIKNDVIYYDKNKSKESKLVNINTKIDTFGVIPFVNISETIKEAISENQILLTQSMDNMDLFVMEPHSASSPPLIIMGNGSERMNILRVNKQSKKSKIICENIPFVSKVKWNKSGTAVAFYGDGQLRVYSMSNNDFILQQEFKNIEIVNFGWSPDGKEIYTETKGLPNDSTGYIDSGKMLNSYETKGKLYFKGRLDSDHYYGTKYSETPMGIVTKTYVVDENGEIIKDFPPGRFRDSYGKSFIQVGDNGKGLYFFKDINKPKEKKVLTTREIYDAKFVDEGKIIYVIRNVFSDNDTYTVYVINSNGNEEKSYDITGKEIFISMDGKTGYSSGNMLEKINFEDNTLGYYKKSIENNQYKQLYNTIRHAVDLYYRFSYRIEKDMTQAGTYFSDNNETNETAYFDLLNSWDEKGIGEKIDNSNAKYETKITLNNIQKRTFKTKQGYSAKIAVEIKNYDNNTSVTFNQCLEIMEIESKRYVIVGIGTFPYSQEYEVVKKKAKYYLLELEKGTLMDRKFLGKGLEMGEIQFWNNNNTHIVENVEDANCCKIYFRVFEKDKENTYKLIMKKYNDNWELDAILKDRLSTLD